MESFLTEFSQADVDSLKLLPSPLARLVEIYNQGGEVKEGLYLHWNAYKDCLRSTDLKRSLDEIANRIRIDDTQSFQHHYNQLVTAISSIGFGAILQNDIRKLANFAEQKALPLQLKLYLPPKASLAQSFAVDLQETLVTSTQDISTAISRAWALLFLANLISEIEWKHWMISFQPMVTAEMTIFGFSQNIVTHDSDSLVFEAIWGHSRGYGDFQPDRYIVDRKKLTLERVQVSSQSEQYLLKNAVVERTKVSEALQLKQKLSEKHLIQLAKDLRSLEEHYQAPLKIKIGYSRGRNYIEDVSVLKKFNRQNASTPRVSQQVYKPDLYRMPLLVGKVVQTGQVSGRVLLIKSKRDYAKIKAEHIVVVDDILQTQAHLLKQAKGIICSQFGLNTTAALLGREFELPTLIGVDKAFNRLVNNQIISLDAVSGRVYEGRVYKKSIKNIALPTTEFISTKPVIGLEVHSPDLIPSLSHWSVSGAVLLNTEGLGSDYVRELSQPANKKQQQKLVEQIELVANSFQTNELIYQSVFADQSLLGIEVESKPKQPFWGQKSRSKKRKVELKRFRSELKLLQTIVTRDSRQKLHLLLTGVSSLSQFQVIYREVAELMHNPSVYINLEKPGLTFILDELIKIGARGVVVDITALDEHFTGEQWLSPEQSLSQADPYGIVKMLQITSHTCHRKKVPLLFRIRRMVLSPKIVDVLKELRPTQCLIEPENNAAAILLTRT